MDSHKKTMQISLSIEQVQEEYLKRNHKTIGELSEFDKKFIQASFNIKNKYKSKYDERHHSVYLKESPKPTSIFEAKKQEKGVPSKKDDVQSEPTIDNKKEDVATCSSTLMNGKPCTSPAKTTLNGKPVCGRHKGK